ncbi:MAG: hypothetical protein ACK4YF_02080 [Exilispira sp.]
MKDYPYKFIPITKEELIKNGILRLDIIFVTGDTYIDSPFIGVALLARLLESKGYNVGIIPQPDVNSLEDITRLGEPELFWGVTAGSIDSMVANYTALLKKRKSDDLTPGGINNRRPDRATIVYTNLIRRAYKNTVPIIIGGIEASTRRIAHYDFWDNKIRRSILFDSKADILVYGMAEKTILEIANFISEIIKKSNDKNIKKIIKKNNHEFKEMLSKIDGICYVDNVKPKDCIEIPSYEEVSVNRESFAQSQLKFFEYINVYGQYNCENNENNCNNNEYYNSDENNNTDKSKVYKKIALVQRHNDRFLIHNPPSKSLSQKELDKIYELGFNHDAHPFLKKEGKIIALDTIPFSITSHRGCFGGCNFCSISIHQGKKVISRSSQSIIKEINNFIKLKHFNGIIKDVGGPTANMYEVKCKKFDIAGSCARQSCLYPDPCKFLEVNHIKYLKLLEEIKKIPFIKKIFIASGIRYDLILLDKFSGKVFLTRLLNEFTSGQFKIAPEHTENEILKLMGKPANKILIKFLQLYSYVIEKLKNQIKKKGKELKNGKKSYIQNKFISFYLIAAYPGCKLQNMEKMKYELDKYYFIDKNQVQIFTPLPLTYAALQYYLEKDPKTGQKIFVEKDLKKKKEQKDILYFS